MSPTGDIHAEPDHSGWQSHKFDYAFDAPVDDEVCPGSSPLEQERHSDTRAVFRAAHISDHLTPDSQHASNDPCHGEEQDHSCAGEPRLGRNASTDKGASRPQRSAKSKTSAVETSNLKSKPGRNPKFICQLQKRHPQNGELLFLDSAHWNTRKRDICTFQSQVDRPWSLNRHLSSEPHYGHVDTVPGRRKYPEYYETEKRSGLKHTSQTKTPLQRNLGLEPSSNPYQWTGATFSCCIRGEKKNCNAYHPTWNDRLAHEHAEHGLKPSWKCTCKGIACQELAKEHFGASWRQHGEDCKCETCEHNKRNAMQRHNPVDEANEEDKYITCKNGKKIRREKKSLERLKIQVWDRMPEAYKSIPEVYGPRGSSLDLRTHIEGLVQYCILRGSSKAEGGEDGQSCEEDETAPSEPQIRRRKQSTRISDSEAMPTAFPLQDQDHRSLNHNKTGYASTKNIKRRSTEAVSSAVACRQDGSKHNALHEQRHVLERMSFAGPRSDRPLRPQHRGDYYHLAQPSHAAAFISDDLLTCRSDAVFPRDSAPSPQSGTNETTKHRLYGATTSGYGLQIPPSSALSDYEQEHIRRELQQDRATDFGDFLHCGQSLAPSAHPTPSEEAASDYRFSTHHSTNLVFEDQVTSSLHPMHRFGSASVACLPFDPALSFSTRQHCSQSCWRNFDSYTQPPEFCQPGEYLFTAANRTAGYNDAQFPTRFEGTSQLQRDRNNSGMYQAHNR